MKAAYQRLRAARIDRAQQLLNGEVAQLVLARYMEAPLDGVTARRMATYARKLLEEREAAAGITVSVLVSGKMASLRAVPLDRR